MRKYIHGLRYDVFMAHLWKGVKNANNIQQNSNRRPRIHKGLPVGSPSLERQEPESSHPDTIRSDNLQGDDT